MRATLAGAVIIGVVGLSFAAPASAFLCTQTDQGASLFWDKRTVVLRPSDHAPAEVSAADVKDALEFGSAQWAAVDCSDFALEVGASVPDRRVGFDWRAGSESADNVNLVVFRGAAPGDPQDEWLHASSALAITTVTFLRSTGRIVDADIEVNDAGFAFTSCEPPACTPVHDLKNMLTHELGHALGLDHPPSFQPGAEEATMYASAPSGDLEKRTLADDDVAGLCTLYPSGEPAGQCGQVELEDPPSIHVEQVGCAQAAAAGPPLLALWVLLLILPRRQRERAERTGLTVGNRRDRPRPRYL